MSKNLKILISYGLSHVRHINSLLIPSIKNSLYDGDIELILLHYIKNGEALFESRQISENFSITDISVKKSKNFGFAESMNFMFKYANENGIGDNFLVLNPDTVLDTYCIEKLITHYKKGETGIIEAKQYPSEHPKSYDKKTFTTSWASGACILIDTEFFATIGGFDSIYFMYCEDVDLSWKCWLAGYSVIYVTDAIFMHSTGFYTYENNKYYMENFYSARNFLIIARKFFGSAGEKRAIKLLKKSFYPHKFNNDILDNYMKMRDSIKTITPIISHQMIRIKGFGVYG